MGRFIKVLNIILISLISFLAVTAIGGGIALVSGIGMPPVEMIKGSIFKSYMIPGLSLLIIVGGVAAISSYLLVVRHKIALPVSIISGIIIMTFEFVEVMIIGSPAGPARIMQIVYFSTGVLISVLSSLVFCSRLLNINTDYSTER